VQTYDHHGDIQLLNHLISVLRSESQMSADNFMPDMDNVNQLWSQLLAGIADREVMQSQCRLLTPTRNSANYIVFRRS